MSDSVSKSIPAARCRPILGILRAHRAALSLLALAGIAQAQYPASPWTRILQAPRMAPDESWGLAEYGRGGPRMVSDAEGTLFIAQGEHLHIGKQEGQSWKTASVKNPFYPPVSVALAAAGTGRILWGSRASNDGGQTWSDLPRSPRSYAIGPHGTALAGTGPEAIFRSVNGGAPGAVWEEAKYGGTYQSITHLTFAFPGWAFAAMPQGDLWISRNDGASWFPLQDKLRYFFMGKADFSMPTMEKGSNAKTLWTIVSDSASRPLWCEGFQRYDDSSLAPLSPDNAGFPDSAVTALQAYAPSSGQSILLLGTWGQGVYVSRNQAASWEKFNGGLTGDLHVEALNFSASGIAQALTREGLFRSSAFASLAIRRKNGSDRGKGNVRRVPGANPLFETAAGRFHVHGRAEDR